MKKLKIRNLYQKCNDKLSYDNNGNAWSYWTQIVKKDLLRKDWERFSRTTLRHIRTYYGVSSIKKIRQMIKNGEIELFNPYLQAIDKNRRGE